jgi:D-serine deaminase-like pyridoxal phosphate-dependent protein
VNEALFLQPYLFDCKKAGREVNVIYGVPPSSSCFKRLTAFREQLGPDSVSFLLDHPAQLRNLISSVPSSSSTTPSPVPIWIKVDPGYHRAGAAPKSLELQILLDAIKQASKGRSEPHVKLIGFYTHMGHSYSATSSTSALDFLAEEIQQVLAATEGATPSDFGVDTFTISVGATPTASSAATLLSDSTSTSGTKAGAVLAKAAETHSVELHAGVYPMLDMQQISTHSRSQTTADIGIRVLAEVLSVYETRETPEALIGAGSLALGREPCQSYPGWGVLAPNPWKGKSAEGKVIYDEEGKTGWMVKRISQEHGIMAWEGDASKKYPLTIGEKVLVWPNHACIAGPNFFGYFVVDGEREGKATEIVDVWYRARGW